MEHVFRTGELCISSFQTKCEFVVLEHLNYKKIINICASQKKLFIIYEEEDGERRVMPLHPPEIDEFDASLTENTLFLQTGEHTFKSIDFYSQVGKVLKIKCSKSLNLILNDQLEIFSSGIGHLGALGSGIKTSSTIPKKISKLQNVKVTGIAVGDNHALALGEFGDVYSWGRGIEGQLGLKNFSVAAYPTRIPFFDQIDPKKMKEHIKKIYQSFENEKENEKKQLQSEQKIVDNKNKISTNPPPTLQADEIKNQNHSQTKSKHEQFNQKFKSFETMQKTNSFGVDIEKQKPQNSCRSDVFGQNQQSIIDPHLVFESEIKQHRLDSQLKSERIKTADIVFQENMKTRFNLEVFNSLSTVKVTRLYAVGDHSFALTNFHALYSWGQNLCGQLGLPIKTGYKTPQFIAIPEPVYELSCQKTHTLLITTNLNLYAAGLNNYFQTGLGPDKYFSQFKMLENDLDGNLLPKFKSVATTPCYSIAVSIKNKIYCWGKCFLETTQKTMYPRKKVFPAINQITDIYAIQDLILIFKQQNIENESNSNIYREVNFQSKDNIVPAENEKNKSGHDENYSDITEKDRTIEKNESISSQMRKEKKLSENNNGNQEIISNSQNLGNSTHSLNFGK